jgi:hypothetical protein
MLEMLLNEISSLQEALSELQQETEFDLTAFEHLKVQHKVLILAVLESIPDMTLYPQLWEVINLLDDSWFSAEADNILRTWRESHVVSSTN